MTVSITEDKVGKFNNMKSKFTLEKTYTIRQVAELIGLLISFSVAIPYGMLYTKIIEREKSDALKFALIG